MLTNVMVSSYSHTGRLRLRGVTKEGKAKRGARVLTEEDVTPTVTSVKSGQRVKRSHYGVKKKQHKPIYLRIVERNANTIHFDADAENKQFLTPEALKFAAAMRRALYRTPHKNLSGFHAYDFTRAALRHALQAGTNPDIERPPSTDPAVNDIAQVVERMLPVARSLRSAATIAKLVDTLVAIQDPIAAISAQIDADNAQARVQFVTDFPCQTAEQVTTNAGSMARNKSQTASRWKAEGKIFAVPFQGQDRFPSFQFRDGRPIASIAQVLKTLPDRMSPWEIAFWFVSTNGWLDGAAPYEKLDDPTAVIEAARLEGDAVIG